MGGGILAGVTFIVPGTAAMILLNWLYVKYGKLPQVNNALFALKPAVLGIIAAGIIKLGRAAIRNWFLAVLLVGAFAGMRFGGINFLAFVLGGAHYVEKVRDNETLPASLAGISAAPRLNDRTGAVVGVIVVVSLALIGEAIVGWASVAICLAAFLLITLLKRDVALVAVAGMIGGTGYAFIRMFAYGG